MSTISNTTTQPSSTSLSKTLSTGSVEETLLISKSSTTSTTHETGVLAIKQSAEESAESAGKDTLPVVTKISTQDDSTTSTSTALVDPTAEQSTRCRCMLTSAKSAERSWQEAFNCLYLSQTFVQVHTGDTIWTHPKIAKLLELAQKPGNSEPQVLINWQSLHGTTMQRARFDLEDIENGKRDTFQTASQVDPAKLGFKPNKVVLGIFFSEDISLASSYAWPRPEQGKKGEKGQPTPVIFDVLIGTQDKPAATFFNEYEKQYTDGLNVYPMTAKEYLGETRHKMCQPAKQKLVNLSKWGIGGAAAATTVVLGKVAYDRYQASRFSLSSRPTLPEPIQTSSSAPSLQQPTTPSSKLRITDEQLDAYTVSGS